MTNDEVRDYLIKEGYLGAMKINDEEFVGVFPYLFTCGIHRGLIRDIDIGYEQRWCYNTAAEAFVAMADWSAKDFEGEPRGWHRHLPTFRRRPNGDVTKEYIKP